MRTVKLFRNVMIAGLLVAILAFGVMLVTNQDLTIEANPATIRSILIPVLIGILGGVVFLVGLVGYVFLPAFDRQLAEYDYGGYITALAMVAMAVILNMALLILILAPGFLKLTPAIALVDSNDVPTVTGIVISGVTLDIPIIFLVWIRIVRPRLITWQQMGLTTQSLGKRLMIGVSSGVGILFLSAILEFILQQLGVQSIQEGTFKGIEGASPPMLILAFLTVGILAPVAEEIFFRGYMFTAFQRQKGLWKAFLFSSVIFGALHLFGSIQTPTAASVVGLLPFVAIGLALAAVYYYSKSLVPAIVAHATNNSVALILLFYQLSMSH